MPVMNDLNGVPTLYTLRYSGVEFQMTEKTIEINYTSSANETVSLTGLEAHTLYEISVTLSTSVGEGSLSSIQNRTLETGKCINGCMHLTIQFIRLFMKRRLLLPLIYKLLSFLLTSSV